MQHSLHTLLHLESAWLRGPEVLLVGLIPLISGILYSVPLFPETWRFRRLKEIPLMKNLLVAGAWALTLSLLPVYAFNLVPVYLRS